MRWLLEDSGWVFEKIGEQEWMGYFTAHSSSEHAGVLELHELGDGRICGGSVMFSLPVGSPAIPRSEGVQPKWLVEQLEPLTLSPSILCSPELGGCGHHGYIRDGRWVA